MKKILSVALSLIFILSSFALFSCSPSEDDEKSGETTRMTLDLNPSVEFMLDGNGNVTSVTALNDDGAILIAGESFVGLSGEEASALFVELARELGYLVNTESEENEITVSVSGDSQYAENLKQSVKNEIISKLESLDVEGRVAEARALTQEELISLLAENSEYSEEELEGMSEEELYNALALARVESALLLTEELRKAYFEAKEYEISFTEREETSKIIDEISTLHAAMNTAYKTALSTYKSALDEIETKKYELLISTDSEYQKALSALRERKAEVILKKNELASSELSSEKKELLANELSLLEAKYTSELEALDAIGTGIYEAINLLLSKLRTIEEALVKLESEFSDDIKAVLESKASEIETAVNASKDSFFEAFEEKYKDDINASTQALLARKQALIDAQDNSSAE